MTKKKVLDIVLRICKEVAEDMPSTAPAIRHIEERMREVLGDKNG
jgi:hypothetical protein